MSYVVSVDVGIKNVGLAVFDFRTAQVVELANVSLVQSGRYIPGLNVHYVREFVKRHQVWFDDAFCVLIERQLRCNMRIIEALLQQMFFDKAIVINARNVKMHYDLGTRNYRLNKQKAVEFAQQFVQRNPGAFKGDLAERAFKPGTKLDDVSDALIMLLYYLDTYSNQLTATAQVSFADVVV